MTVRPLDHPSAHAAARTIGSGRGLGSALRRPVAMILIAVGALIGITGCGSSGATNRRLGRNGSELRRR